MYSHPKTFSPVQSSSLNTGNMVFNFGRNRNADTSAASTAVNSMDVPRAPMEPVTADGSRNIVSPEKGHSQKVPVLTLRTFLMAILVAMGGFIFGYDTGQISGFLDMPVFLMRFGQPTTDLTAHPTGYYFTNVRSGLIVAMLSIGTLIGCLIAAPLANKFGRKWCIPLWCTVFSVGVIAQMAVGPGNWVGITMGRWTAGLGVGGLSVLVPLYMSETSPVPVRGSVVSYVLSSILPTLLPLTLS
jgi:SP family sugar:H+ symporter-like MFS transporter